MDREADVVDMINHCNQDKGQHFIIRARHDRSTISRHQKDKAEAPELFRRFHLMRALPDASLIRRRLRDGSAKVYEASCDINYRQFTFRDIDQPVFCVWVRERKTTGENSSGQDKAREAAEWFLLTDIAVTDAQKAEWITEQYTKRWTVEDFHKCYKTDCSIEARQFDSRKALITVIGLLALPAVRLLRSRYIAREQSEAPFETVVQEQTEQKLAKAVASLYLTKADEKECKLRSALWWLLLLGRMGGHQGIRQKGLPGWQTLWKGYAHFQSLLTGFRLAHNSPDILWVNLNP